MDRISKTENLAHEINCAAHTPGSPFEATADIRHAAVRVQVYDAMGSTMFWLTFLYDCQPEAALKVIRGAISGLIGLPVTAE